MYYKYNFPVYGLLFQSFNIGFDEQTFLILVTSNSSFFLLWLVLFVSSSRSVCLAQGHEDI